MQNIAQFSKEELESLRKKIREANPTMPEREEDRSDSDAENAVEAKKTSKKIEVVIEDAGMTACIWMSCPEEGEVYTVPEVMAALRKQKIVAGIKVDCIMDAIGSSRYEEEVPVAFGKPLVEATPGYFEFFFKTESNDTPEIRADGTVDYSSMGRLENVEEGQLLAVYHPSIQGEKGYNVSGVELIPKAVRELNPLRGKDIRRDEGTESYYATASGRISYNSGNIEIMNVYEITEDVTVLNGQVEFYGDLFIKGNVDTGAKIRARRNITITGTVGAANITAGGDIILQKGVQGAEKANIVAMGNVYADFIEYANVSAKQEIFANSIVSSEIRNAEKVTVTGKRGKILGGSVSALKQITVYQAGNENEIKTYLHAGFGEEEFKQFSELEYKEKKLNERMQEIAEDLTGLLKLCAKAGMIRKDQKITINNLNEERKNITAEIEQIQIQKREIGGKMAKGANASIIVKGKIYPNVTVSVDVAQLVISRMEEYVRFVDRNDMIERVGVPRE